MRVDILPMLSDNYSFLVSCEKSKKAAIVDPPEASPVIAKVKELGLDLVAVFCTHHHWDHIGGISALTPKFDLAVYGHESDKDRSKLSHTLEDGETFKLGELEVKVHHVPGHTTGALAYRVGDAIFVGDALFGAGCGRLFEGDAETMYKSLNETLAAAVEDDTKIYFAHEYTQHNLNFALTVDGENPVLKTRIAQVAALRADNQLSVPSTWAEELATNPFLRCDDLAIKGRLKARFADEPLDEAVAVFAKLRELRNDF